MFSKLKKFLVFGGIFPNENTFSSHCQYLKNCCAVASMILYYIGGLVYSFKYQDVAGTVKSAGYAYNNIFSVLLSYLYMIWCRNDLKQLIDAWDAAIIESWY